MSILARCGCVTAGTCSCVVDGVTITGEGVLGDPFVAVGGADVDCITTYTFDPDDFNADAEKGGDGSCDDPFVINVSLAGGGGVIDSYMFIATDSPSAVASVTPTTVPVNSASFGGTVFVLRGSDLSWAIGNPTRVNILTTGVYDIGAFLLYSNGGGAAITVHTYLSKNGGTAFGTDGFQLMTNPVIIPNGGVNTAGSDSNFNGLALTAGDYLELTSYVLGAGGSYIYGGITVRRTV